MLFLSYVSQFFQIQQSNTLHYNNLAIFNTYNGNVFKSLIDHTKSTIPHVFPILFDTIWQILHTLLLLLP